MIKAFIASTRELDDVQVAVDKIKSTLDVDKNLMKNSLGIVSCFSESNENGVLKAVCDALPFDCIGATTCLSAGKQDIDTMMLVVTVLTSDDCEFLTTAIHVDENYEQSTASSLTELLSRATKKPAVALAYLPAFSGICGDQLVSFLDKALAGTPIFGTVAADHSIGNENARTVFNGELFCDKMVLGVVCGEVDVEFEISYLNEDKIRKQMAIITESSGQLLMSINGKSVLDYLKELGLKCAELSLGVMPFVIEHRDGKKPMARAVIKFNEQGHAVCGGWMPKGAALSIGRVDTDDVLSSAAAAFDRITEDGCGDGVVLGYSCLAHFLALGAGIHAEAEVVRDAAAGGNYHFAYGCGEICPTLEPDGTRKNNFHNYCFALCKLS